MAFSALSTAFYKQFLCVFRIRVAPVLYIVLVCLFFFTDLSSHSFCAHFNFYCC